MTRFAPSQPDLFAPPADKASPPQADPITELNAMLARLRAAERMPWADAAAAMAEELRALGLACRAGAEGEALAAAIMQETERLLATTD